MSIFSDFFGTPPEHAKEKENEKAVAVTTPEFDITQYVKKLSISIGVLAAAAAAALKLFDHNRHPGLVAAGLGLIAVALLGICLISAVDIAARAYVTRGTPPASDPKTDPGADPDPKTKPKPKDGEPDAQAALPVGGVARRLLVWLEGESQPRLVLAVAGDGAQSKYLLSGSEVGERDQGKDSVQSLEGSPTWHDAKEVRAVKTTGWS